MKQGLRKVVGGCQEDLVVMNKLEMDASGNRTKRQKLSNKSDSQPNNEERPAVLLHSMGPEIKDSVGSEECTKTKKSQLHSTQHSTEERKSIPPEGDFFLSRRKKYCGGEDLSSKLSDELMLIIFRWLPKRALVHCAFVCKRWRRIAYDESLWARLDLSSRVLKTGSLSYVLARGVVALRLAYADVQEPIFSPCSVVEDGAFNKLQYLDLSFTVISGKDLAEMLTTCQSLLKLSLERCCMTKESCSAIAKNTELEVLNMTMCSGINEAGLRKILSGCKKLSELNLAWTGVNSSGLEMLSLNAPRTLGRLNISGCGKYLTDKHIQHLVQTCPDLLELDLSDCTNLTTLAIEYICNLKKLEHIALSRCYNICSSSYLFVATRGGDAAAREDAAAELTRTLGPKTPPLLREVGRATSDVVHKSYHPRNGPKHVAFTFRALRPELFDELCEQLRKAACGSEALLPAAANANAAAPREGEGIGARNIAGDARMF